MDTAKAHLVCEIPLECGKLCLLNDTLIELMDYVCHPFLPFCICTNLEHLTISMANCQQLFPAALTASCTESKCHFQADKLDCSKLSRANLRCRRVIRGRRRRKVSRHCYQQALLRSFLVFSLYSNLRGGRPGRFCPKVFMISSYSPLDMFCKTAMLPSANFADTASQESTA